MMNLKDYIKRLQHYEAEYGELTVIYSSDDEGNRYSKVYFEPSLMQIKDLNERNLEIIDGDSEVENINAICIN